MRWPRRGSSSEGEVGGIAKTSSEAIWLAGLSAALIAVVFVVGGLVSAARVQTADSTADWLVTKAFVDGLDPYAPVGELASRYGVSFWDLADSESRIGVHPRTPGGLLLQAPLVLLDSEDAYAAMVFLGFVAAGVSSFLLASNLTSSSTVIVVATSAVLISQPMFWSLRFASQSPFVMLLLVLFAFDLKKDRPIRPGVWLALAITLKVFPVILLAYLIGRKRWASVVSALTTLGFLNLIPLLLRDVSLEAVFAAFTGTASGWRTIESNLSLSSHLATSTPITISMLAVGFGAFAWVSSRSDGKGGQLGAIGTASTAFVLLAIPVAWPHYLLAIFPFLFLLLEESRSVAAVFWPVLLSAFLMVLAKSPTIQTAVLVALAMAALWFLRMSRRISSSQAAGQTMP